MNADDDGTAATARAQSEVIGVVLVTGLVVLVSVGAGAVVISNVMSQAEDVPSVNVEGGATTESLTIQHAAGDGLLSSEVAVVVDTGRRTRYPLSDFSQQTGDDPSRFDPGDAWRLDVAIPGDSVRVFVVHEPSNTVLDEERFPVEAALVAQFSYTPSNPTPLDTVAFDAGASHTEAGGTITSYEWDFDGDGTTDATGETVTYGFPDDGTYPVTLTVTTADGRTANATRAVTVYNQFPEAAFTVSPSNPRPEQTVAFDASASTDPDGTVESYEWDFDDDGTVDATGPQVSTSFDAAGNYTVRLDVTDDDGAISRRSKLVSVRATRQPFTAVSATSILPYADGQYQTVAFTVGEDLAGSATVTVDVGTAQSTAPLRVNYGSAGVTLLDGPGGSSPQFVRQNQNDAALRYYAPSGGIPAGERILLRVTSVAAGTPSDQQNPYTATFTRSDGGSASDGFSTAYDDGDPGLSAVSVSDLTTKDNEQTVAFTLDSDLAQGERVTVDLSDGQRASGNPPRVNYGSSSVVVDSGSGSVQFQEQGSDDANVYYTAGPDDTAGDRIEIRFTGVDAKTTGNAGATFTVGLSRSDADTISETFTVTKSGGGGGGNGGNSGGGNSGNGGGGGPPCDGPSNAPQCR
jgi:PKD repeat protein